MWIVLWNLFLVLVWFVFVVEILFNIQIIFCSILAIETPLDPKQPFIVGVPYKYTKTGKQRWMEALGSIWVMFVSGVIVYFISIYLFPLIVTILAPAFKLY